MKFFSIVTFLFIALLTACGGKSGDSDPCEGVNCSGHGTCMVVGGSAACDCDPGYKAVGLSCVEVEEDAEEDGDAPDVEDISEEDDFGDLVEEDPAVEVEEDISVEEPPADSIPEDIFEDGDIQDGGIDDLAAEDIAGEDPVAEDIVEEEIVVVDCSGLPDFTPCVVITDPDRSYDICIGDECRSPGCGDAACNPPGPHFPLPDTNQRLCYNGSGEIVCPGTPGEPSCATTDWCGQDAQYGWDTEHESSERFSATEPGPEDEPVVTDNVTGLIWQGCPAGQSGSNCATGTYDTYTWNDALAYCDGLTWGEFDDWHLPDRYELQSIVDYGRREPSIDVSAFPDTQNVYFWSSSSLADSPSDAWVVYFNSGGVGYGLGKDYAGAVRCVRFGQPAVERFTRSGTDEPVVTDSVTGLV